MVALCAGQKPNDRVQCLHQLSVRERKLSQPSECRVILFNASDALGDAGDEIDKYSAKVR